MDTIMSWAKENFDLICLLVGVLGVIISIVTLIYEMKVKSLSFGAAKKESAITIISFVAYV